MKKKLLTLLLCSFMVITPISTINSSTAYAGENSIMDLDTAHKNISLSVEKAGSYLSLNNTLNGWQIPSIIRLQKLNDTQKENILSEINTRIEKDYADEYSTQMAKDVLSLTSLGQNPQTYKNYDLINKMLSMTDYIGSCNYEVWILFTSTINSYSITDENKVKIQGIIDDILSCQNENGGFAYTKDGELIDVDMTGMALFALNSYSQKNEAINNAIKSAKEYMISQISENGGKLDNSNSTAMAILGLSSTDYDCTLLAEDLISYQTNDGSFVWQHTDKESNTLSTEQALYALIQYTAAKHHKNIFDFSNKWTYSELTKLEKPDDNIATAPPSNDVSDSTATLPNATSTTATTTASSTPTSDEHYNIIMIMMMLLGSTFIINNLKKRNVND